MNENERNELLNAILGDDELAQLREHCLVDGMKISRRRRQRAVVARMTLAAVPILLLTVLFLRPPSSPSHIAPPEKKIAMSAPVEFINEEQFLALFPNQPIALVGKPGHRQVIFLDQIPAPTRSE